MQNINGTESDVGFGGNDGITNASDGDDLRDLWIWVVVPEIKDLHKIINLVRGSV